MKRLHFQPIIGGARYTEKTEAGIKLVETGSGLPIKTLANLIHTLQRPTQLT